MLNAHMSHYIEFMTIITRDDLQFQARPILKLSSSPRNNLTSTHLDVNNPKIKWELLSVNPNGPQTQQQKLYESAAVTHSTRWSINLSLQTKMVCQYGAKTGGYSAGIGPPVSLWERDK